MPRARLPQLFAQLTTEGQKFFGFAAAFRGLTEAEWTELEGALLFRARIEESVVTPLSAIRNDETKRNLQILKTS